MSKKIIFICTSNRDRSPALVNYFKEVYPENEYRSAGINDYFCSKHGTHLVTQEDLDWADLIVYAEDVHSSVVNSKFNTGATDWVILNCGEYKSDSCISDDYLMKSHVKLSHYLHQRK